MRRHARLHLLLASVLASVSAGVGCVSMRSALPAGGCAREVEPIPLQYAANATASRRAGNGLTLPWTDTLPPAIVRDDHLCARAALATVDGHLPDGVEARAAVVRAGGLYFVRGPGSGYAGEFTIVEVFDAQWRRVARLAG